MKMKTALLVLLSLCLVASSLGDTTNSLLIRHRREVDFIANSRQLVEELINNLRESAQQALDAVNKFAEGIRDQGREFADKVLSDITNFRERVNNAIKSITDRFTGAESGVRACIESHTIEADNIFNSTIEKSKTCAEDRIQEIQDLIENLRESSTNATDYASNAVTELRNCTENSQGFLSVGTCVGSVAVRTELRGALFLTQSGFLIARINLALTTLPAALEVCAGTRLVEAGVTSAKMVVEIGTCSASSVYTSLTGNNLS